MDLEKTDHLTISNIGKLLSNIFTFGSTEPLLVPLWFLASLFTVSLLFSFLSYCIYILLDKKKELIRCVFIICLGITGFLLSKFKINLLRFIDTSLVALLFFYAGYLYKRYENIITMNFSMAVLAMLNLIIGSFYIQIEMVTNRYSHIGLFLLDAMCGIYITIYLSKRLSLGSSLMKKIVSYIGNISLYILGLHLLFFKIIQYLIIQVYNLPFSYLAVITGMKRLEPWWILYTLVGVIGPVIVVQLYNRLISLTSK